MWKTVPFQTIQFSISTQFNSIWPIDRTLSGATIPGQSGSGRKGNEGVVSHSITMPHTTKPLSQEQTYVHSPPDPYLVREESLYLL